MPKETWLLKKSPTCFGKTVHYHADNSWPLVLIMSCMNLHPHITKMNFFAFLLVGFLNFTCVLY